MKLSTLTATLAVLLWTAAGPAAAKDWQDNIDMPFVDDPAIAGAWTSVDFVDEPGQFDPKIKRFEGDLYLKELVFEENGKTTTGWWTWTKGFLIHHGDKTASKYESRTSAERRTCSWNGRAATTRSAT